MQLVIELVILTCPETIVHFSSEFNKVFTYSFNNKNLNQNILRLKDRKIIIKRLQNFKFFKKHEKIIFKEIKISHYTQVPEEFFMSYKEQLNWKDFWKNISMYQTLSRSFIDQNVKQLEQNYINKYQK